MADYEFMKEKQDELHSKIRSMDGKHHNNVSQTDSQNLANWRQSKANMEKFDANQEEEEQRKIDYLKQILDDQAKESELTVKQKIDNFEKNLMKLGLNVAESEFNPKNQTGPVSSEMMMQKIKDKIRQKELAKKEKERRNRRLKYNQNKNKDSTEKQTDQLDKVEQMQDHELEEEHAFSEKESDLFQEKDYTYLDESLVFNKERFIHQCSKESLKHLKESIQHKTEKRAKLSSLLKVLTDEVLQVTEQAAKMQEEGGSDVIERGDWENLMNRFVSGQLKPKKLVIDENDKTMQLMKSYVLDKISQTEKEMENVPELPEDTLEIYDYFNYIGNWNDNIMGKYKRDDVFYLKLFREISINYGRYKFKKYKFTNKIEIKEDDKQNLLIEKSNPVCNYKGDMIDALIESHFKKENTKIWGLFDYIPIKICLSGPKYSGKRTISSLLEEKFGLTVLKLDEMLSQIEEILVRLETPIEDHPKFKNMKKAQIEQLEKEKAEDEEANKHIKEWGLALRENPNNSAVLAEIVVHFIKTHFPLEEEKEFKDKILKNNERIEEIREELDKIKEEQAKKPKAKVKEEQQLNAELEELQNNRKGFVLVNYPRNKDEAAAFENILTGYVPKIEQKRSEMEEIKGTSSFVFDKTPKPEKELALLHSGIECMICLYCKKEELIRRAEGLLQDPQTGKTYHEEDSPPPEDPKIKGRLVKLTTKEEAEEELSGTFTQYTKNIMELSDFYDPFGSETHQFNTFKFFDFDKIDKEKAEEWLEEIMGSLLHIFEEKQNEVIYNFQDEPLDAVEKLSQFNSRNDTQKSILHNREMSVDKLNVINQDNEVLAYFKKKDVIKKKFSPELVEEYLKRGTDFIVNYIDQTKKTFKFLRHQSEMIVQMFDKVQNEFIGFLKRLSNKDELISKIKREYNRFIQENGRIMEFEEVRAEYRDSLDYLKDRIWHMILERKDQNVQKLSSIINREWINTNVEKLLVNIEKLIWTEIYRYNTVMRLLRDFYFKLEGKPVPVDEDYPKVKSVFEILVFA